MPVHRIESAYENIVDGARDGALALVAGGGHDCGSLGSNGLERSLVTLDRRFRFRLGEFTR